ncbi:hypothetical protein ADK38_37445, partial [Streptomyces varsoviensis]
MDPKTGRLLAARGETVPLDTFDGRSDDSLRPRLVATESGAPRLLSFAYVDGPRGTEQLVVAAGTLRL